MYFLIFTCSLLAGALMSHIALWRISLPRHQTRVLLVIFFAVFACGAVLSTTKLPGIRPLDAYEWAKAVVLYASVMLAYLTTYSAVEVDSPSLVFVLEIYKRAHRGYPEKEFYEKWNDEYLLRPRVDDLVHAGFLKRKEQRYALTARGRIFVSVFVFFRSLLHLPKGG